MTKQDQARTINKRSKGKRDQTRKIIRISKLINNNKNECGMLNEQLAQSSTRTQKNCFFVWQKMCFLKTHIQTI